MTAPRIKICGITRVEDAEHAVRAGADFLGLNFWPRSKRYVETDDAAMLAAAARKIRPQVEIVGLFVDPTADAVRAVDGQVDLDIVQLHGDEPMELVDALNEYFDVWKAHAVTGPAIIDGLGPWPSSAQVLDTPSAGRGGSGTTFDWTLAARAVAAGHRIVLAGGLTPDNVAAAIAAVNPFAVDVASGVERAPGIKDPDLVTAFIAAARGAAR